MVRFLSLAAMALCNAEQVLGQTVEYSQKRGGSQQVRDRGGTRPYSVNVPDDHRICGLDVRVQGGLSNSVWSHTPQMREEFMFRSPGGTEITLLTDSPCIGQGWAPLDVIYDDAASGLRCEGYSRPVQALSNFIGEDAKGSWTLIVKNRGIDSFWAVGMEVTLIITPCPTDPPTRSPTSSPTPDPESDKGVIVGMDGDPHVKAWSGKHFDYHGQCDLQLLHAANFGGQQGVDLDIHVRTTIRHMYSYIEASAVQIGGDVLEVGAYGDHAVNDVDGALSTSWNAQKTIGGYLVHYTMISKKSYRYDIVLSPHQNITLSSFKDLVAVHLDGGNFKQYLDVATATGIMGTLDGKLVGRDGVTDMSNNINAHGQEWQVRDVDPKLFRTTREPQYPAKCILPSLEATQRRRLGESRAEKDAAEAACSQFSGVEFDECVYDVMSTGDLEVAQAGAF